MAQAKPTYIESLTDIAATTGAAVQGHGDQERYDEWARTYDESNEIAGFTSPRQAAEVIRDFASPDAKTILDVGAGTGLVMECLQKLGFSLEGKIIHGFDLSQGMLDVAKTKGLYTTVKVQDVMDFPWDVPSDSQDLVVCNGVLSYVTGACLAEFHRVTTIGGHIVLHHRHDKREANGYAEVEDRYVADGQWELKHKTQDFFNFENVGDEKTKGTCNIWCYIKRKE